MALKRLFILLMIFASNSAWSAYNADKIKADINNKEGLFKVSEWKKTDKNNTWHASTSLKRVVISVSDSKADFIAPFINPRQMKDGKMLCAEFGAITSNSTDKKSQDAIKEVIRKATTRHNFISIKLNGVQFTVKPKIYNTIVSLHCSTKAI